MPPKTIKPWVTDMTAYQIEMHTMYDLSKTHGIIFTQPFRQNQNMKWYCSLCAEERSQQFHYSMKNILAHIHSESHEYELTLKKLV